ncbi:MAG TPA: Sec-independent protein translocase protein TatB [Allosphingosinicella sp.]|nr:Sec-independent protein translocase protein TatB [Allosphingosinicella sp.]
MFDVAPTELLLIAIVALLVIGPKDLPRVMRTVGHWAGRARGVARHFRSGFDAMIREAELEEMEKKWQAENERIMRDYPAPALDDRPDAPDSPPLAPPKHDLP